MVDELFPVSMAQYAKEVNLRDIELELNTITTCYACRKEGFHKSCANCFSTLIDSIVNSGRPDFEVLRSRKLIKKNGKYYTENGREVIDKSFISCADAFGNIQELS